MYRLGQSLLYQLFDILSMFLPLPVACCMPGRDLTLRAGANADTSARLRPGGVLWTREEALASILAVEVVDLPMSANQVSIEEEFGDQAGEQARRSVILADRLRWWVRG